MAISVTCPGCQTSYPVTEDLLGKTIRCKKCQETFTAKAARSAAVVGRGDDRIQKAPAAVVIEDDDFEPRNGTPRPAAAPPKNNNALIVAGSIGGVTILGLLGALVWALNRDSDVPVNPNPNPHLVFNNNTSSIPPITTNANPAEVKPADAKPADTKPADATAVPAKPTTAQLTTSTEIFGGVRMPRPANFRLDAIERAKKAAVFIFCVFEQGGAFGSGWVAEKNGNERFIVTNSHVVGMKERGKPAPDKIEITFDSGTPQSRTLEGKLLALDREEDLAVIRVKGPDLPEPMQIAPSFDLLDTQKLLILGFPFGGNLKQLLKQGLGVDVTTSLKTRETTVNGRYYNEGDGSVKYIGVEGGADPGNSGGAAVDTNGNVTAVLVAGDPRSNLRMVIPSEYVSHLLAGRILRVFPGQAIKSGNSIKQPIRAYIADPMKRLRSVSVDVWPGAPIEKSVKIRSASASPPQPLEGDGPHSTATLNFNSDAPVKIGEPIPSDGELTLPVLKGNEVYWFQPHYVAKDGKERWGEAIMLEMGRYPVEAKPAMIAIKHTPDLKPDDIRMIHLMSRHSQGAEIEELGGLGGTDTALRADLTEKTRLVDPRTGEAQVHLQYVDLHLKDPEQDLMKRKGNPGVMESVKNLSAKVFVTRDGKFRSPTTAWAQVPQGARGTLEPYNNQILESLETLSLSLPNKDLQPGDTWSTEVPYTMTLALGPGNKRTENALIRTTCKYVGTRERNGREEAVVELTGTVVRNENASSGGSSGDSGTRGVRGIGGGGGGANDEGTDSEGRRQRGVSGLSHGSAVIDLATGLVTIARTESDIVVTTQISLKTRDGQDVPLTLHLGFNLDTILQRGLTKTPLKPIEDPSNLLPNMGKIYNPLVGVGEPLAADAPTKNTAAVVPERTTSMAPDVLKKIQKAAVRLDVETHDGLKFGSGWFAEPGLVVTNCQVVGMESRSARKPVKITVVLDSGTAAQRRLSGKLLSINRQDNLAVIKVEGENLPEPMRISPSTSLASATRLTIFGFPYGTQISDDLFQGLGTRDLAVTLKTRTTSVSDKVYDTNENLKFIQYEGGGDDGNAGSPVVDSDGNVRCIHVYGMPDPRMPGRPSQLKFGVPSEYALRMLQGFPLEIHPEYSYLDGSTPRQPVKVLFADPLRRVSKASIDVWVGSSGKNRKPSESLPKAKPGESVRQTFDLRLEPDADGLFIDAVGEFPLPARSPGQVFWLQPRFVNSTGKEQWGGAMPFSPDGPPVDRRKVVLEHKLPTAGTERTLEMESQSTFRWQRLDTINREGNPLKAIVTEKVIQPRRGTSYVQMSYKDLIWDLPIRSGDPRVDSQIRQLLKQFTDLIKGVVTVMTINKEGILKAPQTDYSRVPLGGLLFTKTFNDQLMQSLVAMSVPFPNKQVQYLDTWDYPTNLFIETRNRFEASLFNMKLKYLGVRDRGGRLEAVIEIEGSLAKNDKVKSVDEKELKAGKPGEGSSPGAQPEPPPGLLSFRNQYQRPPEGKTRGLYGLAKGHAYFDVNGGYVTEVQLFIDVDVQMTVKDADTKTELPVPAGGTMEVLFKRLTNTGSR